MDRLPENIQDLILQMRVSDQFIEAVDQWRSKQDDAPTRPEAVRRLVESGLEAAKGPGGPSEVQSARAKEMASDTIDRLTNDETPSDDKTSRKQRLMKGPEEFRQIRKGRPKTTT